MASITDSYIEVADILEYWEKRKILYIRNDGIVRLTSYGGVDEIKATIKHPEKPTENFPAHIYNYVVNILGDNLAPVQVGKKNKLNMGNIVKKQRRAGHSGQWQCKSRTC